MGAWRQSPAVPQLWAPLPSACWRLLLQGCLPAFPALLCCCFPWPLGPSSLLACLSLPTSSRSHSTSACRQAAALLVSLSCCFATPLLCPAPRPARSFSCLLLPPPSLACCRSGSRKSAYCLNQVGEALRLAFVGPGAEPEQPPPPLPSTGGQWPPPRAVLQQMAAPQLPAAHVSYRVHVHMQKGKVGGAACLKCCSCCTYRIAAAAAATAARASRYSSAVHVSVLHGC